MTTKTKYKNRFDAKSTMRIHNLKAQKHRPHLNLFQKYNYFLYMSENEGNNSYLFIVFIYKDNNNVLILTKQTY